MDGFVGFITIGIWLLTRNAAIHHIYTTFSSNNALVRTLLRRAAQLNRCVHPNFFVKNVKNTCSLVGNIVSPAPRRDYDKPDFSGALSQWQEFRSRSHEVKATNNNCYYGLSVVPTRTRQRNYCSRVFQYLAAQEAIDGETVPEGMIKLTIPPQKYAKPQVIDYHG
jgi:hypothetical protein